MDEGEVKALIFDLETTIIRAEGDPEHPERGDLPELCSRLAFFKWILNDKVDIEPITRPAGAG